MIVNISQIIKTDQTNGKPVGKSFEKKSPEQIRAEFVKEIMDKI